MSDYIIQTRNIKKDYPGVQALKSVDINIKRGSVHCIVGENGAGKSTFIKILTGAEQMTSGEILLDGEEYSPRNVSEAMGNGISVLYQELNTVEGLTVEENLMLGKEKTTLGVLRKSKDTQHAKEVLCEIAPEIKTHVKTKNYSVAQRQMIEISRAIADDAKILILDEPTAALSAEETECLFHLLDDLRKKDVTVIYISHRLEEIFEIGDYITVFRDGNHIDTKPVDEVASQQELIRMMLGKVVVQEYIPSKFSFSKIVMSAKNLSNRVLNDVSFDLYEGEILGFYGLIGSGKSEIARAIYGIDAHDGEIIVQDTAVEINNPWQAVSHGIVLAPEERRTEAIFPGLSISDNISIMNTDKITSNGIINPAKQKNIADLFTERLHIATDSINKSVAQLSGGNQQKVVVSKCLNADPEILMLDEPTRGVDVGAKEEVHNIIRELASEGKSVIVFSSEMSEIINLCDRIVLLNNGEVKAVCENHRDICPEELMDQLANE